MSEGKQEESFHYKDVLNALVEMQQSPAYAVRRETLQRAEDAIVSLERCLRKAWDEQRASSTAHHETAAGQGQGGENRDTPLSTATTPAHAAAPLPEEVQREIERLMLWYARHYKIRTGVRNDLERIARLAIASVKGEK